MMEEILDVGKKIIPKVYDDVASSTLSETGKLLGRIPKLINAALAPLDIWIAKRNFAIEETKALLAKKLEGIEAEKIVPPEPYVAIPALEGISYSMDSHELREMYANLLAQSMNSDTKENVHPAFVDMIKQMSPLDSRVLSYLSDGIHGTISLILEEPYKPIDEPDLKAFIASEDGHYFPKSRQPLINHITSFKEANIRDVNVSLDNLQRLGLLILDNDRFYTDRAVYESIRNSAHFVEARNLAESEIDHSKYCLQEREGMIEITDLGRLFSQICISNV